MKFYPIFLFLFLYLPYNTIGQNSQVYFSTGIVRSDLHVSAPERESEINGNRKSNQPKTGFIFSAGINQKVWKNIYIDGSLNYQERLPLEKIRFSTPAVSGINGIFTFSEVPTSPQSRDWNPNIYNRIPNFKYTHFEVVPLYSFGNQLQIMLGIGLFYGHLINNKKLILRQEDFPAFDEFFMPPFNVSGVDSYRVSDVGWLPKVKIAYTLSDRLRLGLSGKIYISEYALKSKLFGISAWGKNFADTWQVFNLNLDFIHILNKNKHNMASLQQFPIYKTR